MVPSDHTKFEPAIDFMQDDPFTEFRHRYACGEGQTALRALIPSPQWSYDAYDAYDAECAHLVNYADALACGWPDEARQANLLIQGDAPLGPFGEAIVDDEVWLWQSSLAGKRQTPYDLAAEEPVQHARWIESEHHRKQWATCKQIFPFLDGPAVLLPLLFESVATPPLPDYPAILVEPVPFSLDDRPALLLFPDAVTLQHCLAIPGMFALLHRSNLWIHLLDHHPSQTLGRQPPLPDVPFSLVPLLEQGGLERLNDALTASPDELAVSGREVAWKKRAHRLGQRRQVAHRTNCLQEGWHSLHKSFPLPPMQTPQRTRRPKEALRRIAHIVPQIIDAGHAPTRLYKAILPHHTLEAHLFVTDEHVFRTTNYPYSRYYSDSSNRRGEATLQELQGPMWVGSHGMSYGELASSLAQELDARQIDAAIFHTASPFMQLAASFCTVPCIALFDHGHLEPGFDLYFAATPKEQVRVEGSIVELPHATDVQKEWDEVPYPPEYFGVAHDAQLLTTISYHLDNRLSDRMCEAIATILTRCPRAHYLPIGPVTSPDRILQHFHAKGVADRLHFLGAQSHPSQLARSMHLYLNEFPFGSGLALLDAMGAGIPVVSMHDPDGPYQARAAGNLYGLDRVITTGDPADYTALACRLLADPSLHAEWSQAAVVAYERRGAPSALAPKIEEALRNWFRI